MVEYTCAVVSSLAPTHYSRRTLSLYIMLFYRQRYAGGQLSVASLPTGICILHIMGSGRRSNCTQCPRLRTLADVPYIFVRGQSCASVRMISNLASKYRSVLDGFENNKSRQVTQYPLTNTILSGVYPKHIYTPQILHYPPPQHKRALNKERFEVKKP